SWARSGDRRARHVAGAREPPCPACGWGPRAAVPGGCMGPEEPSAQANVQGPGGGRPSGSRRPRARLQPAGLGLADELRLLPSLGDGGGVDVAHAGAQAPDQLGDDAGDRALEGELHLLAFGDVLVEGVAAALDLEAGGGSAEGGHAPEDLVLAALAADDLARTLGAAGEQAPDHDRARPRGDRLRHVAGG